MLASVPYWVQDEAVASFEEHIDLIDYLSVFWYHLGPDGQLRKYVMAEESRALIERAHERGVKVLALVANLPDEEQPDDRGTWDAKRVRRVIGSEADRRDHIAALMALTRRMNFDGIYLDYEELPGTYREDFTRFVEELSEALHAEDKLLAVALHPKTSEDNPLEDNGSAAQDWEALHRFADQLHFMTYGEHTAETPPGPVASVGWIERVLRYAVETRQVPPAKIYMGMSLYAAEWYQTPSGQYRGLDTDIMFEDAKQRKRAHHGTERWSAKHGSPYIVYHDRKYRKRVIWFENKRSSAEKLAVGNALGICKLSLWRLGGEDPEFWDVVREQRSPGQAPAPEGSGATEEDEQEREQDEQEEQEQEQDEQEEQEQGQDEQGDEDGGRSHPRLTGDISASMEFYSVFASTDPVSDRENWLVYMDGSQALELTSRLGLESNVRVVLESDGEDERYYTDFPHEGLYVRSLLLRYRTDRYSVFAGKYEPALDIRGHAPIFFGNHSVDLRLDRRLGVGASATLAHAGIGQHTLTGHAFHADTSRLSGEVLTGSDRNRMYDGGLARTDKPDSYLVTLNGGSADSDTGLAYTLGWGRQKNGDPAALDEHIYLGALKGTILLPRLGYLTPSLDVLSLRHAGGQVGSTRNVLLGLAYAPSAFSLGGTYSIRFLDPGPGEDGQTDRIAEILARYEIGRGFAVEAAYQNIREGGEQSNLFGVVLGYVRGWVLP
ncbi:MAG TPA: glycosyl hydrolase family 18 protein [Haliangium sp.]|nr:glycosyl hydrolase family 18 protein [Haliangium sp.]